jgi:signal transduction histidine kinase
MQDLHDGLLQSLATHILRLETCRKYLLESPTELENELQSIENDTRKSMREIRQFLKGKETQSVLPGMLIEKIKEDLRFLRDGLGLNVIFDIAPEDLEPPEGLEQDLYLVLREGLMNVARHSHASRVDLAIKQTETGLSAALRDDGVGFDPATGVNDHGLGLSNMKERVRRLGGELHVQSSPGNGTRISFLLPLETKTARVA